MKIEPHNVPPGHSTTLTGHLPPENYELPLKEYGSWDPIAYHLIATRTEDECLIAGTLSTTIHPPCARCLDTIHIPIQIPNFSHTYKIQGDKAIDLTPDIREDILLDLPLAPRCQLDENERCPFTGKSYKVQEDQFQDFRREATWSALDQIENKESHGSSQT